MKQQPKFYVSCLRSQKTGKDYPAFVCDLGYRRAVLSYDTALISELLEVPVSQLYGLKVDEKIYIGGASNG